MSRIPEVEVKEELFDYLEEELDLCKRLNYYDFFKPIPQPELLQIFPESIGFITEKVGELLQEREIIKFEFECKITKNTYNETEYILLIEIYKNKLEKIEKKIKELKGYLMQCDIPTGGRRLTRDELDTLKQTHKISDLILEFYPDIQLRKSGRNITCLCPFHLEKNPSFYINPEKNLFYCFGCGVGGDVIDFVMLAKNLNFKQVIEFLKRRQDGTS